MFAGRLSRDQCIVSSITDDGRQFCGVTGGAKDYAAAVKWRSEKPCSYN